VSGARVSRARMALRGAGESFAKGIPLIGLYFSGQTLDDASKLLDSEQYFDAALTGASLFYDPIDWGHTVRGLWDFVAESKAEYDRAKSSEAIHAELRRMSGH
jgi:hypothetical protein